MYGLNVFRFLVPRNSRLKAREQKEIHMIRSFRGLFGVFATCASVVCVAVFGHSSASAQPCVALQEAVTASTVTSEVPVEKTDTAAVVLAEVALAFPRLEVVKGLDVQEFITNNGIFFGVADGGEFVWVSMIDDLPILMVDSFVQIDSVQTQYNDEENVIEIQGVKSGSVVHGKLFLAAFGDRVKDESNVHLVFEISNPEGFEGIRFIFDSQTGAIHSPRCTCAGRGLTGPGGPCGVVDCDEGRVCGELDRPRACWWEPPNGPRLVPIGGSAQISR